MTAPFLYVVQHISVTEGHVKPSSGALSGNTIIFTFIPYIGMSLKNIAYKVNSVLP